MRNRDIRNLRKYKRTPWTQQRDNDKQQQMDAAFAQLDRERAQQNTRTNS